jgi:23S rRNA pseudouridine1911/1915/1917 synthase
MLWNLDGKLKKVNFMEEPIILYEDNHVIVVLKPQSVPSCEDESKDLDMLTIIKNYIKVRDNKPGNVYLGLVHRLDRPTGGVMVFAKTSKSAERLCKQIKTDEFEKTYFTVVYGVPRLKQSTLKNYLKKDEKNNIVKICTQLEEGAKEAILDYQVLETVNDYSLVKVNLQTGRSHQIRVQMANIGCPVVNDAKYSGKKATGDMALWATVLKFTHPVSKQRLTYKVIPPADKNPWKMFNIEKYL